MDAWSIVAWLGTAHVLGSALALVLVSVNRGETEAPPPPDDGAEPFEPGIVPLLPLVPLAPRR